MAPALPVYTREEIESMYPKFKNDGSGDGSMRRIRGEKLPKDCKLYELIQNQCTYDGNEVFCLPFKRVFLRCLENREREVIGYKLTPLHKNTTSRFDLNGGKVGKIYRDIEITDEDDNHYPYDEGVRRFLKADKVLRKKMKEYYDKMKEEE